MVVAVVAACGGGSGGGVDAERPGADASPTSLAFRSPVASATVLGSAVVDLDAGAGIDAAEVSVVGEATPRCTFAARPFVCLIDVTGLAPGPISLSARGTAAGAEVATASVAIDRRAYATEACAAGAPTDCVAALVASGAAAGYTGLSYHDMDNGHAALDVSAMPGIESQINQTFAGQDPWHTDPARIVVANQSEAFNFGDGWMSIPRNGTIAPLATLWEQSKLFIWPEHRDHGYVDYYPWQTPTLVLSQGSSGSELDETAKLLAILAALPADVRSALHQDHALMSVLTMLHRRARVATDVAYLEPAAHTPAFVDADVGREGVQLAASVRLDEVPPVARLTVESATIPPEWATAGVIQQEATPYAMVWSPYAVPATPPTGTFTAVIDLAAASTDANARPLYYFARVVRGDAARIRVTQLDSARFQIDADFPAEVTEMVNGHDRASRRATVAFFAHNGLWLSEPVFVSVFGGNPAEHAPDSNDLD